MPTYIKTRKPRTVRYLIKQIFKTPDFPSKNHWVMACETYKDKNCLQPEGMVGKFRSFDALYELVKTYFPFIKPEELFFELISAKIQNEKTKQIYLPYLSACSNIRKQVFVYSSVGNPNLDRAQYNSKWNWKDLAATKNIYTTEELIAYRKRNLK